MTHAFTLSAAVDPIHAAIERHRTAYDAYQTAPEGTPSIEANDEYDASSDALVSTACATRFGALALLTHLRWWLFQESEFREGYQPAYGLAETRAADLTLFLGTNPPPVQIPRAMASGRLGRATSTRLLPGVDRYRQNAPSALANEPLPGEIEPWEAIEPVRPDTAHCRALRIMDAAGEMLVGLAIIAGGVLAYGFMPSL